MTTALPNVALIHAYSRANRGDGLLTDLSIARLARAGLPADRLTVVALDAASFDDLPSVIEVGTPTRRPGPRALRAAGQLTATALGRGVRARLRHADAYVGVGGGYLTTETIKSSIGMYLNHVPQLMAAAHSGKPNAYLPISIGPFSGPAGRRIPRLLNAINLVCVRDDPSGDYLPRHGGVHRIPDLAVLDVVEAGRAPVTRAARIAISARELGRDPDYEQRIVDLARALPDALWAVQVEGVGSKSDRLFYRRLGIEPAGSMPEVLASGEAGAIISVRLHGAIMAIRHGVPAIHLAYGTKGRGAYDDLGITAYLDDARTFAPEDVADRVKDLLADPASFWDRIDARREVLTADSERLTRLLASVLGTTTKERS